MNCPFCGGANVNGHRNLDVTRDQDLNPATDFDTVGESKMADIAIVGGGPSGAMCGAELARAGHTVNIFDKHLAWEKPCGGGLTHKAIQNFPFLLDNPYPKKLVSSIELISSDDHRATLDLTNPIVIYSRKVLNGMLLERAAEAGCKVHQAHVFSVDTASDETEILRGRRVADGRFSGAGGRSTESTCARDAGACSAMSWR